MHGSSRWSTRDILADHGKYFVVAGLCGTDDDMMLLLARKKGGN
jgi:hypothetical protein